MKRSRWVLAAGGIAGLLAVYLVVTPFVRDYVLQFTGAVRERSEGEALAYRLVSTDSLLEYSMTHPDQVALACWEIGDEANGIFFNAGRSQPAAQLSALLVLAAYAPDAEQHELGGATVSLAHWERYWLPGTDGGAHLAALFEVRASGALHEVTSHDRIAGSAETASGSVHFREIARAMIRHADPSAMDVLIDHLGRGRLTERVLGLGFPLEAVPLPSSAVQRSLLTGDAAPELLARYRALQRTGYADEVWRQFALLRARNVERIERQGTGFSLRETAALSAALAPRGTAEQYGRLLQRIVTGELPGADYMRAQLDLPLTAAGSHSELAQFGTVRASEPGLYASVSHARARGARAQRVLALMFRKLPMGVWLHLSSGNLLRRFEGQLLGDEAFFAKARAQLNPRRSMNEGAEARYWSR